MQNENDIIHGWRQNITSHIPYTYRGVKCFIIVHNNIIDGCITNNFTNKSRKTFGESEKRIKLRQFSEFLKTQSIHGILDNKVFFTSTTRIISVEINRRDAITKVWNELKMIIDELYDYCDEYVNVVKFFMENIIDGIHKKQRCYRYGYDNKNNTFSAVFAKYESVARSF
jgi:hypothetical protein